MSTTTYVVGIDGSTPSLAALRWAMHRARILSGAVRLVHVIEDEWGLVGGDFVKEAIAAGDQLMTDSLATAEAIDGSVSITTRILHGSPVWELTHNCSVEEVLVVGTHKTGFLRGRVLGSRSVSIAAMSECSVIVVPDGQSRSRNGVVAGVSWPDGSTHAVASATREAVRLQQPLTLVHASAVMQSTVADSQVLREGRNALMHRAEARARAIDSCVEVRTHLSTHPPAEALLDASHDASLLVLEPSRDTDIASALLGSTTHDVLMNINAPVLVTRSETF